MSGSYLRVDHWTDAVWSLEGARDFASHLPANDSYWKWLIVSVHSAVQGFMTLALEQGNGISVMNKAVAKKWLEAHETGATYPEARMDYFGELYDKVKSEAMLAYVGSRAFAATSDHDYSMGKLNELRNQFIHFFPTSWSIERIGLPTICIRCLEVVSFLGWESGTIIWHDPVLAKRAEVALGELQGRIEGLLGVDGG